MADDALEVYDADRTQLDADRTQRLDADRTPEVDLPAANTALCSARQHPEHRCQHLREFERLVDGAARRERAKRATPGRAKRRKHSTPDADSGGYLSQPLVFSEGRLVDAEGGAVMMGWEDGLMRHHAAALRQRLDDGPASVLNVGFGLGLIDEALQREWRGVRGFTHTILEAHPDVLRHARSLGWHERPGVTLLAGRWQEAVPALLAGGASFDAVFYDTYAESYADLRCFFGHVPRLLSARGAFSYFNGAAAAVRC